MYYKVILFLIGVVQIYYQVSSADVEYNYIAELMVGSNITLEANTIMIALNDITSLENGSTTANLSHSELIAECLILGDESTCNCSTGYVWSNIVCYTYNCCREISCTQNVSHITPLCIAKVKVLITGSAILNKIWDDSKNEKLAYNFGELNGFQYLNVTGHRLDNTVADFEAAVTVKFTPLKLEEIRVKGESILGALIQLETLGMVTIESPKNIMCYMSKPVLKCTFDEKTDLAGWNISKKNEHVELGPGSVVRLNDNCTTDEYKSCTEITLENVTSIWAGSYECGFTRGSIRHTAKAQLRVALLPEEITMNSKPLVADCSGKGSTKSVPIEVSATILKSSEKFIVSWSYKNKSMTGEDYNSVTADKLTYTLKMSVTCKTIAEAHSVCVTFKNTKKQKKTAEFIIPVIYDGEEYCNEEDTWPKTPDGDTVIQYTCAVGRVGFESRTCKGTTWQDVFHSCVSEELNNIANVAVNFQKGLGTSPEIANDIFSGLKNSSTSYDNTSDTTADIFASINILNVMAEASLDTPLQEGVLNDFVATASNMLENDWNGVNESKVQNMSSLYLESVEGLVKNIKVEKSRGFLTQNLDLKFCFGPYCNDTVFGIDVNLYELPGIKKTLAVKNLTNRLRNNIGETYPTSLLVSVTLQNRTLSPLNVSLKFPVEKQKSEKPMCVFWNAANNDWSVVGCSFKTSVGNHTVCECTHLTAFSVLMAKADISTVELDIITNVGLAVSICSLLIFLIIEYLVWTAVVKSKLSYFRHTTIVNIAVFLLLADCSFLASTYPDKLSETWCLVLTICKHLFFLAMFNWMLCMSVMLVHQLIFVFSPLRKRVFMLLSSIVGYVFPMLIVGSSYVYCKYTNRPYYNKDTCWLVFEKLLEGSIHAFLLPVGTIILTNIFSMMVVILTLVKSSAADSSKVDKEAIKSVLKVVLFLTPVFGGTWIIGFALLLLDGDNHMFMVANYSFTILNSFQGLFLLITGCFAEKKVRDEVVKIIMAKSKGKSDSTKNLTSTTKDK
ncbi:adhesion G protein-coupled receptor F4 [Cottoperca gobio]|uniref:Adhesion G protein-coupled receptor F4 n=1 Tax=Cottoperca gobio TaxID=56716 RepID=A0A6J2P931_COTGO|nr:adhesion G protein-coupled receptor F4-like [Cottoperca gobio]